MGRSEDQRFLERAVELALASEQEGNLPIGSVIVLDGEIVGEGKSQVLRPCYHPGRHAEVQALRSVDNGLWDRAREMTCYSTLEPCVMCAGTLLLHGIGRVVFGAFDVLGGAGETLKHLPPYYDKGGVYQWDGPLLPEVCDTLYRRADRAFEALPVGRKQWSDKRDERGSRAKLRRRLDQWMDDEDCLGQREARRAIEELSKGLSGDQLIELLPYSAALFERGGYLKDYRSLQRLGTKAERPEILEQVQDVVRRELPDIWIVGALKRGEIEAALDCWFEQEEHRRIRHCADSMIDACGAEHPDLLISGRLSQIDYWVGRRARRHYRRACAVLRKLRDELDEVDAGEDWDLVIADVVRRYEGRPALLDELKRAGFVSS